MRRRWGADFYLGWECEAGMVLPSESVQWRRCQRWRRLEASFPRWGPSLRVTMSLQHGYLKVKTQFFMDVRRRHHWCPAFPGGTASRDPPWPCSDAGGWLLGWQGCALGPCWHDVQRAYGWLRWWPGGGVALLAASDIWVLSTGVWGDGRSEAPM
jgi:hypothetical protein